MSNRASSRRGPGAVQHRAGPTWHVGCAFLPHTACARARPRCKDIAPPVVQRAACSVQRVQGGTGGNRPPVKARSGRTAQRRRQRPWCRAFHLGPRTTRKHYTERGGASCALPEATLGRRQRTCWIIWIEAQGPRPGPAGVDRSETRDEKSAVHGVKLIWHYR